jgi:hypothetical protein
LIVGTEADTAIRLPIGTDGQVLTADAELSTGVKWADVSTPGTPPVSYAVQWTSSSNPQPANGTLTGHYIAVGKLITAWGELRIDASTTFGTNAWYFSLPVLANTELLREGGYQAIGQVWAKDYGADNYLGTAVMINNAKFSVYPAPTGTSSWRPTVPFKWAEGDSLSFKVQYIAVIHLFYNKGNNVRPHLTMFLVSYMKPLYCVSHMG